MVFKGNGLVWNPKTNCAYRFTDGKYETDDPEKIAFFKAQGFTCLDDECAAVPEEAPKPNTKKTKKGQA